MELSSEFVERVASRMNPYVEDGTLLDTWLTRVLHTLDIASPGLAEAVAEVLGKRGVRVVTALSAIAVSGSEVGSGPFTLVAARQRLALDRTEANPADVILTPVEEVGLAQLIRGPSNQPLPRGGIRDLRGEAARAAACLVVHNQRLVYSIARQHKAPPGMSFEDLAQHGMVGLLRAVEKFDPALGNKFSTYATWWIAQAIGRGVANESRLIRLPVHMHHRVAKVWREREKLTVDGRSPSIGELARICKLTPEEVLDCLTLRDVASLDKPATDGETTLGELLDRTHTIPSPEESLYEGLVTDAVEQALDELTSREADILRRRFGLGGLAPETLEGIGSTYGVTRERIRQLEEHTLKKLREGRDSNHLQAYY